ncbi:MAG: hypothetical protein FD163_1814 [Hyphomonadaceae bacterium]|nr:MAG: hypothetical protein FD128_1951 [Hyphomonadaceae bacterium]KAF0184240.1 MAG: hypothetical protein FD163_1814 [Hyphomonadaceae bacterium]
MKFALPIIAILSQMLFVAQALAQQRYTPLPAVGVQAAANPVLGDVRFADIGCDAGLQNASGNLLWTITLGRSALVGAKLDAEIIMNGASLGVRQYTISQLPSVAGNGPKIIQGMQPVAYSRNSGNADFRFNVAGREIGRKSLSYSCVTLNPISRGNQTLTLPDLAIGPHVFVYWQRPERPRAPPYVSFSEIRFGPPSYAHNIGSRADMLRPVELFQMTGGDCRSETDTSLLTFAVSIVATGASPQAFTGDEGYYYYPDHNSAELSFGRGTVYFDTRTAARVREGNATLPQGFEWLIFHRRVPCTANGTFDFVIDANNRLRESNETNNSLRFRFNSLLRPQ